MPAAPSSTQVRRRRPDQRCGGVQTRQPALQSSEVDLYSVHGFGDSVPGVFHVSLLPENNSSQDTPEAPPPAAYPAAPNLQMPGRSTMYPFLP